MKSTILWATLLLIGLPLHSHDFQPHQRIQPLRNVHSIRTIVIDAGHGGKDSGSLGKKTQEKTISLKIALLLGEYIETHLPHIKVIQTRRTDEFIPLYERAQTAHDYEADIFVSIHCNSLPPKRNDVLGTETYVMGLHTSDENLNVAKRENAVVLLENNYQRHYDGYDPNSPEAHIILSMYQNAYLKQSLLLADKIEDQFKSKSQRPSRGVKQAGFVVLRATAMPSVLVETGFLSNSQDEAYLSSEKGQVYTASAIYRALRDYITLMEKDAPVSEPLPKITAKATTVTQPSTSTAVAKTTTTTASTVTVSAKAVYKIQLASSPTAINTNTGKWKTITNLERDLYDNSYKYLVGNYTSWTQAVQQQTHWRGQGFKDAFVVAYQNGKRINLEKAKTLIK